MSARTGGTAVRACAGAGKTRRLVSEFVERFLSGGERILAITFTELAASEMRERVAAAVRRAATSAGPGDAARFSALLDLVPELEISTIHSFCRSLIASNSALLGVPPDFQVLDDVRASVLRRRAAVAALLDAPSSDLDALDSLGRKTLLSALCGFLADPFWLEDFLRALRSGSPPWREGWSAALVERAAARLESLGGRADPGFLSLLLRSAGKPRTPGSARRRLEKAGFPSLAARSDEGIASLAAAAADYAEAERLSLLDGLELSAARALAALAEAASAHYSRLKRGNLDFSDLVLLAHRLLCSGGDPRFRPVRERLRRRYTTVMVDEFQDTNRRQWEIVAALTGEGGASLFIVGDEQQSIFGFQGAEVEVFRAACDSASLRVETAASNYRSAPAVLRFCNAVFPPLFEASGFPDVEYVPMTPVRPDPPGAGVALLASPSPLEAAAALVRDLLEEEGFEPGRVAVLARRRGELASLASLLAAAGVPFSMGFSADLSTRPETMDFAALLAALLEPGDDFSLARFLRSPLCGLSDRALLLLSSAPGECLHERLFAFDSPAALDEADRAALDFARSLLREMPPRAASLSPAAFVSELLNRCGAPLAYGALPGGSVALASLSVLPALAASAGGVEDLLRFLREGAPLGPSAGREVPDRVNLLTVHSAKGLEFRAVVLLSSAAPGRAGDARRSRLSPDLGGAAVPVFSLAPSLFPAHPLLADAAAKGTRLKGPRAAAAADYAKKRDTAEEVRLFYVACTRAAERLFIVGPPPSDKPLSDLVASGARYLDWAEKALAASSGDSSSLVVRLHEPDPLPRPEPDLDAVLSVLSSPPPPAPAVPEIPPPVRPVAATALAAELAARRLPGASPAEPEPAAFGARFGTLLHLLLERRPVPLEERLDTLLELGLLDPSLAPSLLSAARALAAHPLVEPLLASPDSASEWPFTVRLDRFLVTGKADLVGPVPGGRRVVDFKSGRPPSDPLVLMQYRFQLAIYARAVELVLGGPVEAAAVFASGDVLSAAPPSLLDETLAVLTV